MRALVGGLPLLGLVLAGCSSAPDDDVAPAAFPPVSLDVDWDVEAWGCPPERYDAGDGCDCGCGRPDPDCVPLVSTARGCSASMVAAVCDAAGACVDACAGVPLQGTCSPDLDEVRICSVDEAGAWSVSGVACADDVPCTVGPDGVAACACSLGALRCAGPRQPEVCVGAAWAATLPCSLGQVCVPPDAPDDDNACGCADGLGRCIGESAVQCVFGVIEGGACPDGCLGVEGLFATCAEGADPVDVIEGAVLAEVHALDDGDGARLTRAMAEVRVGVVDLTELGPVVLGIATTDESGAFAIPVTTTPTAEAELVIVPARTESQVLRLAVSDLPMFDVPRVWSFTRPLSEVDGFSPVVVTEAEGSAALHLFDRVRRGIDWARGLALDEDLGPTLLVQWDPAGHSPCLGSAACFLGGEGLLSGEVLATSIAEGAGTEWAYVPLHELGHWLTAALDADSSPGGPHSAYFAAAPTLAWAEGVATFFALAAHNAIEIDDRVVAGDFDLESGADTDGIVYPPADPDAGLAQSLSEAVVFSVLWDLADDTPLEDPAALGFDVVIAALALPRLTSGALDRGAAGRDLVDFLDALWCAELADEAQLLEVTSGAGGFPYEGPPLCP